MRTVFAIIILLACVPTETPHPPDVLHEPGENPARVARQDVEVSVPGKLFTPAIRRLLPMGRSPGFAGQYLGELEPLEPRPGGYACLGWCRRSGQPALIDPGRPYSTDIDRKDCEALLRAACEG